MVDLTLKIKEKGKNSIGLNGGVSGLEGAFVGINYATNNFLGLGETLQVQASVGNLAKSIRFGFTEPYMFDKPLQFGFNVYVNRTSYNQARQLSIFRGQTLDLPNAVLQNLQNYTQSSAGFTSSLSYPLRRSFKRVGITYSFDRSSLAAISSASKNLFEFLAFRGISGPNALEGIITSKIFPNFSFNTIDSPILSLIHIYNGRGEIFLKARVDGAVQAGVVSARLSWAKLSPGFRNINVLTSEKLSDLGNSATFYSVLVEVESSKSFP